MGETNTSRHIGELPHQPILYWISLVETGKNPSKPNRTQILTESELSACPSCHTGCSSMLGDHRLKLNRHRSRNRRALRPTVGSALLAGALCASAAPRSPQICPETRDAHSDSQQGWLREDAPTSSFKDRMGSILKD